MLIWRTVTQLAKDYNVKYTHGAEPLLIDEDMADRVFDAAIELVVKVGAYCIETGRIINFTEDEVREDLNAAKDTLLIGEGKDRRLMKHRGIEDYQNPPLLCFGHSRFEEQAALAFYRLASSIPYVDMVDGFIINRIRGAMVQGKPYQVIATQRQVSIMRDATAYAGRPGIHLRYYPIHTDYGTLITAMTSGIRPTDAVQQSTLPEMKVQDDYLSAVCAELGYGCFIVSRGLSFIGGYGGGPNTSAIEGLACTMVARLCYRADYLSIGSGHLDVDLTHDAETLWCDGLMHVAYARNFRNPLSASAGSVAECSHPTRWMEMAAAAIHKVVLGGHLEITRPRRALRDNLLTPLEVEYGAQVRNWIVENKLGKEEANTLVKKLLGKYEYLLKTDPKEREVLRRGKTFDELYDMTTLKPREEHLESYRTAVKELSSLGIDITRNGRKAGEPPEVQSLAT